MKNLKDTVLEKLSVDSISEKLSVDSISEKLSVDSIVLANNKFPIDGTINDIVEFLKENDFKDTAERNFDSYQKFSSKKAKCFNVDPSYSMLWFTDTTKETTSKRSPVFYIYKSNNTIKSDRYDIFYINKSERIPTVINDKKEFSKELNKQFGWK